jgi:hypothetical protein
MELVKFKILFSLPRFIFAGFPSYSQVPATDAIGSYKDHEFYKSELNNLSHSHKGNVRYKLS